MGTDIKVERERGYLRVTLTGDETPEGNRKVTAVVAKECAAVGFRRVLTDVTGVAPHTGMIEDFDFAEFLAAGAFPRSIRLAIVFGPERKESAPFFETLCQNRGVNVMAFPDEAAALQWLMA
jgi:hypothetical protein